jgi:hypothetical protein
MLRLNAVFDGSFKLLNYFPTRIAISRQGFIALLIHSQCRTHRLKVTEDGGRPRLADLDATTLANLLLNLLGKESYSALLSEMKKPKLNRDDRGGF